MYSFPIMKTTRSLLYWEIISAINEKHKEPTNTLPERLVAGFPPRRPGFEPGSGQVWFVVDKVALGQVFSEYFGFPCQTSFHQILHHHNHPGQVQ
jgi:hypothetical protein